MDLLRHFFTRGHDGRVTCVDASAAADFVVSGGVDYTVRPGEPNIYIYICIFFFCGRVFDGF